MIQLANKQQRFIYKRSTYRGINIGVKRFIHEYLEAIYRMIDGSLNDQSTTCISRFSLALPINKLENANQHIDNFVNQLTKEVEDNLQERRKNTKDELADCNVKVIWAKEHSKHHNEPYYELIVLCNQESFLGCDIASSSICFELVNCVVLAWADTLGLTSRQSKRFIRFYNKMVTTIPDDVPVEESLGYLFTNYSQLALIATKCFAETEPFWCSDFSIEELHQSVGLYCKDKPIKEVSAA